MMMNIKKILLILSAISVIIGIIGFFIKKMPVLTGLLAGGTLAGALWSLNDKFNGGGGGSSRGSGGGGRRPWSRNKKSTSRGASTNSKSFISRGGRSRKRKRKFLFF